MFKVTAPDCVEYGPVSLATLGHWAQEGRLTPDTIVIEVETGQRFAAREHPYVRNRLRPSNENPWAALPYTTPDLSAEAHDLIPWFSMWTRPRQTIRQIVAQDPGQHVLLLAALAGVSQALARASNQHMGDNASLVVVLVLCLVIGPIGGVFNLYFNGFLLRLTGGWLGGKAEGEEIRAALAWGGVPGIWSLLLMGLELPLAGEELFRSHTPRIDGSLPLSTAIAVLGVLEIVAAVWSFVAFLNCLSEVQDFSVWRALGSTLLCAVVIVVPIAAVIGLLALVAH